MMIKTQLSTLKEITDLRKVWKNEATDFTPWLAEQENIKILSDVVGLDISVEETESSVGSFSADILAKETGTDRTIIIENQLEDTNHDHLGKIITYAAGKSANYIIWIVKHARDEHKAAIEWLNAHTDNDIGFFLCEIKLYQIDDSKLAPMFSLVEIPNEWSKEQKRNSADITENMQNRMEYWTAFNEYAWNNSLFSKSFNKRKPSMDHWYTLAIGRGDAHIALLRLKTRNSLGVEFYISGNKALYDILESHKEEIEAKMQMSLTWKRLDEKKDSRIVVEEQFDIDDKNDWNVQFDWFMNTALAMKKSVQKYI